MIPTLDIAPDGSVRAINRERLALRPFWLVTDRPNNSITLTPQQSSTIRLLSTNLDGPIDISSLAIQSTSTLLVHMKLFYADGRTLSLSGSPLHSSTVFGTGAQPYKLPEALRVNQLQKLAVWLTNLSTENNTVRLCVFGRQSQKNIISPKLSRLQRQGNVTIPYFLTLDAGKVVLTALQTQEVAMTVPPMIDFQLFQISGTSTGTYAVNFLDADTGEPLISAPADKTYPIANNLIVGSNIYPFRLQVPRLFKRGQRIIARITDTSNAGNTVYLAAGGRGIVRGEAAV